MLVDGENAATARTRALALGDRVPAPPQQRVSLPRDAAAARLAVDGLLTPDAIARGRRVTPDAGRAELGAAAVDVLRRAAHLRPGGPRLDYTFDLGPRVRGVVLDTVRRDAGSGGVVGAQEVAFLRTALRAAGTRWVIVFSHQPLE